MILLLSYLASFISLAFAAVDISSPQNGSTVYYHTRALIQWTVDDPSQSSTLVFKDPKGNVWSTYDAGKLLSIYLFIPNSIVTGLYSVEITSGGSTGITQFNIGPAPVSSAENQSGYSTKLTPSSSFITDGAPSFEPISSGAYPSSVVTSISVSTITNSSTTSITTDGKDKSDQLSTIVTSDAVTPVSSTLLTLTSSSVVETSPETVVTASSTEIHSTRPLESTSDSVVSSTSPLESTTAAPTTTTSTGAGNKSTKRTYTITTEGHTFTITTYPPNAAPTLLCSKYAVLASVSVVFYYLFTSYL